MDEASLRLLLERQARRQIAHPIRLRQQRIRLWNAHLAQSTGGVRPPERAEKILRIGKVGAPDVKY